MISNSNNVSKLYELVILTNKLNVCSLMEHRTYEKTLCQCIGAAVILCRTRKLIKKTRSREWKTLKILLGIVIHLARTKYIITYFHLKMNHPEHKICSQHQLHYLSDMVLV